ncbi:MAG TPA: hypothetical protein VGR35_16740 [Tepidisphaeraceae bacterium]|nr:hypothetical protein [Tepidisphaeraceae bacterium]
MRRGAGLALFLSLLILGCETGTVSPSVTRARMNRWGTPHLIMDVSGDTGRVYLPRQWDAPTWRDCEQAFYYLDSQTSLVFEPGRPPKKVTLSTERVDKLRATRGDSLKAVGD